MSGLFIKRHAQAVNMFNDVATVYVHSDKNASANIEYEIINEEFPEIKVYYKAYTGFLKFIMAFLFIKSHLKAFKILKKELNFYPDLLHVNVLTREGVIAYLYKLRYNVKYVITEHWSRYHTGKYKGYARKIITGIVVKNASAVMPVTQQLADSMKKCGLKNNNYLIVPNVVDTELFKPCNKVSEIENTLIPIAHISCTNDETKNISGILKAVKILKDKRSDFYLKIIGDGEDFKMLKEKTRQLGIADIVVFTGLLEGEKLVKEISSSAFHLLFSNYENLPVVNLECFSCGIPVLSSDVGGIREHLNKNLGILTEPKDLGKLVKKIDWMLDNYKKFDVSYLRSYAINNFSNSAIGKKYDVIYKRILEQ